VIAAALAIAVAVGPLIGGAVTTFASWRWVFAGEVMIAIVILAGCGRSTTRRPRQRTRPDFIGAVLSITALSLLVLGVLQSRRVGLRQAETVGAGAAGNLPVIWLVAGGLLGIYLFFLWEGPGRAAGR
jgi:MFS family permease